MNKRHNNIMFIIFVFIIEFTDKNNLVWSILMNSLKKKNNHCELLAVE